MKYQSIAIFLLFVVISATTYADDLVNKPNKILATTPEQAVKTAVDNKDFRFLHIPVCAEGMPGFDFEGY